MRIDATPSHPMRCVGRVDDPSINVAAIAIETMPPPELSIELLRISGIIRRGETVDGARVVAALKAAAAFLTENE